MLLKTVRHGEALWDVDLAAADAPEADLALVFVADDEANGTRVSRTALVDQEQLEDLLREPFDMREDLLHSALERAEATRQYGEAGESGRIVAKRVNHDAG